MRDYSSDSRQRAIELRRQGESYNGISKALGVPKSTLSYWLRDIEYVPSKEVVERVGLGRVKGGQTVRERTAEHIADIKARACREVGELSERDLWIAGIAIYWGDGTKAQEDVRFTNCDPKIVQLMMRWFREICLVPDDRFRAEVHIYPESDAASLVCFWSEVTGIPTVQFTECQVDRRQGKRQKKKGLLPYGTIQVRVSGGPGLGRQLHRRIAGWIQALEVDKRE